MLGEILKSNSKIYEGEYVFVAPTALSVNTPITNGMCIAVLIEELVINGEGKMFPALSRVLNDTYTYSCKCIVDKVIPATAMSGFKTAVVTITSTGNRPLYLVSNARIEPVKDFVMNGITLFADSYDGEYVRAKQIHVGDTMILVCDDDVVKGTSCIIDDSGIVSLDPNDIVGAGE